MHKITPVRVLRSKIGWTLIVLLSCVLTLSAQPNGKTKQSQTRTTQRGSPEQRTASYFESIRKLPPQQLAFLLKMPKGADLHNHLSGAVYAERYVEWAAEKGLCINTRTMILSVPAPPSTCDPKSEQPPASTALSNSVLGPVFAQMVTGFALANDPGSKVVGLNLVQAEDGLSSMQNLSLHMQMLSFLRPLYPRARVTLHAGELAPGFVPPDGLTFHIHESVMTARAERIGHGVDIMHESKPYELLKEMARRNVLVEICLSSNDLILGITGSQHPLATYLEYGVPVALATDDEGVARSEISREFLKAAEEHGLGYLQLKTMARNSLEYAFIAGESLWADGRKFVSVARCTREMAVMKLTSNGCRQHVAGSEKARLQWRLEEDFHAFERQW
jgi:hypothetical protein